MPEIQTDLGDPVEEHSNHTSRGARSHQTHVETSGSSKLRVDHSIFFAAQSKTRKILRRFRSQSKPRCNKIDCRFERQKRFVKLHFRYPVRTTQNKRKEEQTDTDAKISPPPPFWRTIALKLRVVVKAKKETKCPRLDQVRQKPKQPPEGKETKAAG
jgi:hypothetical protein